MINLVLDMMLKGARGREFNILDKFSPLLAFTRKQLLLDTYHTIPNNSQLRRDAPLSMTIKILPGRLHIQQGSPWRRLRRPVVVAGFWLLGAILCCSFTACGAGDSKPVVETIKATVPAKESDVISITKENMAATVGSFLPELSV